MHGLPIAAAIVFAVVTLGATIGSESAPSGGLAPPLEKTSYLTVTTPDPSTFVTVANPRQDEGLIFFVTDITANSGGLRFVTLLFPPGSLFPDDWGLKFRSHENSASIVQSFERPIPIESDVQVKFTADTGKVVFHGYYGRWIGDATHYE